MSGFHRQRLRRLRRAAGLGGPVRRRSVVSYFEPQDESVMPAFLRSYGRDHIHDDEYEGDAAYIDSFYFRPEALRWADEAAKYLREDGVLNSDDRECFSRVFAAMRAGRKPSDEQQKAFDARRKWKSVTTRIPEAYAIEMELRGVKNYGPDFYLPDDVREPGSGEERVYDYFFQELGYKNRDSAKSNHKAWKKANGTT